VNPPREVVDGDAGGCSTVGWVGAVVKTGESSHAGRCDDEGGNRV
jgi:hypothetical protein